MKSKELMQIGKLTLVRESWEWGDVLEFRHTEGLPHPYHSDEVQTDISVDDARELIKHLQSFIDFSEVS